MDEAVRPSASRVTACDRGRDGVVRCGVRRREWRTPVTLGLCLISWGALACIGATLPDDPEVDPRITFALQPLRETPYPPGNPSQAARIELGRLLFFDPILSGEMDVACGTCHHPDFGFADGRQFSAGTSGIGLGPARHISVSAVSGDPIPLVPRNAPTVLNAAMNGNGSGVPDFLGLQFWDGRTSGLEEQALQPLVDRREMRGDAYPATVALDSVMARLRSIPEYVERFQGAFPGEAGTAVITVDRYARAIAAYQRELVTRNSAFDRYVSGDDHALTADEMEGLLLFFTPGKAGCTQCHLGPMLSDFVSRRNGVPQEGPGKEVIPGDDTGVEEHTGNPADRFFFRTPTLRNVELTAPYMHDGVFTTLEEVVDFYNLGGHPRRAGVTDSTISPQLVRPLNLSEAEIQSLVAFLKSLTDPGTRLDPRLLTVPDSVPSGLTPVLGVAAGN